MVGSAIAYQLRDYLERSDIPFAWVDLTTDEQARGEGEPSDSVVGAGATGVETAGALADILQRTPKRLYPNVDRNKTSLTLVDMDTKMLPPFTETSQDYAARILQVRGVELRLVL